MVGLRLRAGLQVEEGDGLDDGVVPWASALSDNLLSSRCASCFGPCSASRLPCPGSCEGTVLYCSIPCRNLDLPLHLRSAECRLLSLLRSSAPAVSSSSFPSLGGSCDIRAALRLLARHRSLNHIAPFLAASNCDHGEHAPRLGGLLSNSSILLQITPLRNHEEDELQLATELANAATLICRILSSVEESSPGRESCAKHKRNAVMRVEDCVYESRDCHAPCQDTETKEENNHIIERPEETRPGALDCMKGGDILELPQISEGQYDNCCKDMDTSTESSANEEGIDENFVHLSYAEKLLLAQEVLCQVFCNGVRIQMDNTWISCGVLKVQEDLGTAVYGPSFSWINHSCKPNAFFSFVFMGNFVSGASTCKAALHPDVNIVGLENMWGLRSAFPRCTRTADQGLHITAGSDWSESHGPRALLRAIRPIKGDEPVSISYVDLMQPKGIRRRELWLNYCFHCNCERCEDKSLGSVDSILEKLGPAGGSQFDMETLEEWLHNKAEDGLREVFENDDPSSCCEVLEGALVELVHQAYYCFLNGERTQCWPDQENLNFDKGEGLQSFLRHQGHLKMHLMHYLCFDIFIALSSSYKVLALGFSSSSSEGASMHSKGTRSNDVRKRKVECSMASAAYALFLAMAVQRLCDCGEPGLMAVASRFWLQNWEALVSLIYKLDSFFLVDKNPEMHNLLFTFICESNSIFCSHDINIICKLRELLIPWQSLRECASSNQLLHCSAMALWPFLRSTSPFLSNVETPFGSHELCISIVEAGTDFSETKAKWLCFREDALICAMCSLLHGLKLMKILCGSLDKNSF